MNCAFVLENILGHTTHAANLKRVVGSTPGVKPLFVDLTPDMADHHWLFKIPKYGPYFQLSWALRCSFEAKIQLQPHLKEMDAIYFHTQVTAGASLSIMKKRPCIVSLDAAPYCESFYEPWDTPQKRERKRRHYKRIFDACAHLVTWSQWAKNNLETVYKIPESKITVIAPGVDTNLFRPADDAAWSTPDATRASAKTPSTPDEKIVRVLFVGGQFHRKGGAWLSRWARSTKARNWEMHIVTRDKLSPRRANIPNVFVHHDLENNSPELIALYQKCDIFAFPTRFDCLGVAAIEALACGLPVLITDVCATGEVVRDGKNGFLIGLNERDKFFARLDQLIGDADLRAKMSQAAREDALARFDADKNYGRLLELIGSYARRV